MGDVDYETHQIVGYSISCVLNGDRDSNLSSKTDFVTFFLKESQQKSLISIKLGYLIIGMSHRQRIDSSFEIYLLLSIYICCFIHRCLSGYKFLLVDSKEQINRMHERALLHLTFFFIKNFRFLFQNQDVSFYFFGNSTLTFLSNSLGGWYENYLNMTLCLEKRDMCLYFYRQIPFSWIFLSLIYIWSIVGRSCPNEFDS